MHLEFGRIPNSDSLFGLANKVSGVQHAVTYLGRRTLRIAVLSFGLVDCLMEATPAVLFEVYWRRALTMACAARLCAKGVNEDEDTAYCAGLFADLGVLVFAQTDPSGCHKVTSCSLLRRSQQPPPTIIGARKRPRAPGQVASEGKGVSMTS